MTSFAIGFHSFATSMMAVTIPDGLDQKTKNAVAIANRIKDLVRDLPEPSVMGHFVNLITGGSTLSRFTGAMTSFAIGFHSFATSMGAVVIPDDLPSKTDSAITVSTSIKNLSASLPAISVMETFVSWVTGDTPLSRLVKNMSSFASGMNQYATSMMLITDTTGLTDKTNSAITIATSVKELLVGLKEAEIEANKGEIDKWFTGDTKANTVFEAIAKLGTSMKTAQDSFNGLSTGTFKTDAMVARAIFVSFANLLNWVSSGDIRVNDDDSTVATTFTSIINQVGRLGASIQSFSTDTQGIDVDRFKSLIGGIQTVIQTILDITKAAETGSIPAFETSMDNLIKMFSGEGEDGSKLDSSHFLDGLDSKDITSKLESFATTVTEQMGKSSATILTYTTQFDEAGQSLANNLNNGVNAAETDTSGIDTMLGTLLSATDPYLAKFETVGKNFGLGMSSGLRKSAAVAVAMAEYVATKMLEKVKEIFDINSPSKEGISIGKSLDEGLAMGVLTFSKMAVNASEKTGSSMLDTTRETLSGLSKVLDSSMDGPPVIRPVVDLSNVATGAKAIGGMLSGSRFLSVGAIRTNSLASVANTARETKSQRDPVSGTSTDANTNRMISFAGANFNFKDKIDFRAFKLELDGLDRDDDRAHGSVY
jgi:hypothetical protein